MNFQFANTDPLVMDVPKGFALLRAPMKKDIDTLYFPKEIESDIGLSANHINMMKFKGCKFFGKKTTLRWVRDFMEQTAEALD